MFLVSSQSIAPHAPRKTRVTRHNFTKLHSAEASEQQRDGAWGRASSTATICRNAPVPAPALAHHQVARQCRRGQCRHGAASRSSREQRAPQGPGLGTGLAPTVLIAAPTPVAAAGGCGGVCLIEVVEERVEPGPAHALAAPRRTRREQLLLPGRHRSSITAEPSPAQLAQPSMTAFTRSVARSEAVNTTPPPPSPPLPSPPHHASLLHRAVSRGSGWTLLRLRVTLFVQLLILLSQHFPVTRIRPQGRVKSPCCIFGVSAPPPPQTTAGKTHTQGN